jgi:hypothetical protein
MDSQVVEDAIETVNALDNNRKTVKKVIKHKNEYK